MPGRYWNHRLLLSLALCLTDPLAGQQGQIQLGTGYKSDDTFRPAQFGGKPESGGFAIGAVRLGEANPVDGAGHWQLQAADLGLDTANVRAAYVKRGSYRFDLSFDQLPLAEIGEAVTVFDGAGTGFQTLPPDWEGAASTTGFAGLNGNLHRTGVDKKRQRFTGGIDWKFRPDWKFSAGFRHENKEGTDTYGAIFGSSGGNPRGALLLRPVDFETDEITLGLDHASPEFQYGISYNFASFRNLNNTLSWENPFNNPQWTDGANFSDGAVGQSALEPDNHSTGVNVYLGYSFVPGTRLTASLSNTTLRQDGQFLPYSSAIATDSPLPRTKLGGKVDILTGNLAFSTRLNRRTTLRLRYRYRDRDNQTGQALFQRVAGDAAQQADLLSDGARVNRVYDLETEHFSADLDYRFGGATRLSLGLETTEKDYNMLDADSTREDTAFIKLNLAPLPNSSGWIRFSRSERDAEGYDPTRPFVTGHNPDYVATLVGVELMENDPFLRRFHISDRDRDQLSASYNIYPPGSWSLGMVVRISDDDYPGALVGRESSTSRGVTFDLGYNPQSSWNANLYYSYENYDYRQNGYSRSGGANPTPFFPESVRLDGNAWKVASEDRIHTLGGGVDWTAGDGGLALSSDLTYSDARTRTKPFSSGLAWEPLPDVTTDVLTFDIAASYPLPEGRTLNLRYFYEHYDSTDFALDRVLVDTLSNVLLLGNHSPTYDNHIVEISLQFSL